MMQYMGVALLSLAGVGVGLDNGLARTPPMLVGVGEV